MFQEGEGRVNLLVKNTAYKLIDKTPKHGLKLGVKIDRLMLNAERRLH